MSNLLARHGEAIFWMARQIERVNNLARLLDVTESFGRDAKGHQNWQGVLRLYAHEQAFHDTGVELSAESVLYFYLLDKSHPASFVSTLHMARENARTLRPLLSTEMWTHLNEFYGDARVLKKRDISEEKLSGLAGWIKEACQLQTGIAMETLYRDASWYFYRLGQALERADQTTRLLDAQTHGPANFAPDDASPVDRGHWNALLRSVAGFHAYRRVHPASMNPGRVAAFLLFNNKFPRSVAACLREGVEALGEMRREYDLEAGAGPMQALQADYDRLRSHTMTDVQAVGLHAYLDTIQRRLISIGQGLTEEFFG